MTWRNWVWNGRFFAWYFVMAAPMFGLLIYLNRADQQNDSDRTIGTIVLLAAFGLITSFQNWITIRPGKVRLGFFPIYWRTLAMSEIRYVIPVEFNPMRDFSGYGIKGLAKSRNGILLGGNPPRGIMIETLDRRRYVLSFADAEPILQAFARQGVTLSAEIGVESLG